MKESETIEFKKSLAELGEGLNSMAAILNKHAVGELWFGMKNDSTQVSKEVTETTLRKVSKSIAAHIEPKIFPEVSNVLLSGKSRIRVSFSGNEKPYYSIEWKSGASTDAFTSTMSLGSLFHPATRLGCWSRFPRLETNLGLFHSPTSALRRLCRFLFG